MRELYAARRLSEGYPDLERLAFERYAARQKARPDDTGRVEHLLELLNRLVDLQPPKRVVVVGCGPWPQPVKILLEKNYHVHGVEPVESFVSSAAEYLGAEDVVLQGAAEDIPLPDASQHLALFESVLEHVDSPSMSLSELYRVLAPGGVLFLTTTNRLRFSLVGRNGEYHVRYFNFLPPLVRESFVFRHLHYDPALANFTERPAVHWFSYSDLCRLGREAGFAKFYSPIDLMRPNDRPVGKASRFRAFARSWLVRVVRRSAWVRALVLTQRGESIIMLKR